MTAISMAYDLGNGAFVIAADGRCAFNQFGEMKIKSNTEQKIFPVETEFMSAAYAMSGFSGYGNGLFETVAEVRAQIEALRKRRFSNGYDFAKDFSVNMANAVQKARKTGRLPLLPKSEELPAGEKGRIFKVYILGYHGGSPFFSESRFYHFEETDHIQVRMDCPELSQSKTLYTGSDKIAAMIYGGEPIDPRIAKYKPSPDERALGMVTAFIEACADLAAVEIDPYCRTIGGHLHAAEITQSGFKWLIKPVAFEQVHTNSLPDV